MWKLVLGAALLIAYFGVTNVYTGTRRLDICEAIPKVQRDLVDMARLNEQPTCHVGLAPPWDVNHLQKAAKEGDEQHLTDVLAAGIDPMEKDGSGKIGCPALYLAIKHGHVGCVRLLIEAGVDPGLYFPGLREHREAFRGTALAMAVMYKQVPIICYLLSTGRSNVPKIRDSDARTVADLAAYKGHVPSLEVIIEYPRYGMRDAGHLEYMKPKTWSLLLEAAHSGNKTMLNYVLKLFNIPVDEDDTSVWKGEHLSDSQRDVVDYTLTGTIGRVNAVILQTLLGYYMRDGEQEFPVPYILPDLYTGKLRAARENDVERLKLLLDLDSQRRAADPYVESNGDERDKFLLLRGLQDGIRDGNLDMVRYLVEEHGLDIHAVHEKVPRSSVGLYPTSAVQLALASQHVQVLRYILEVLESRGEEIGVDVREPLLLACRSKDKVKVRLLLEHGEALQAIEPSEEVDFGQGKLLIEVIDQEEEEEGGIKIRWKRADEKEEESSPRMTGQGIQWSFQVDQSDAEWWQKVVRRFRQRRNQY